jgi:hypothetical protein
VLLYGITPHMHLLGRSISVELNPGRPDRDHQGLSATTRAECEAVADGRSLSCRAEGDG